jgi:hypothetical protein
MGSKALTLAVVVLAITLPGTSPALAIPDFETAKPIPGYPDYEITDKGFLVYQGDAVLGKCGSTQDFGFLSKSSNEQAARACEKAMTEGLPTQDGEERQTPLAETGGPPVILAPIALLVVGGLLIRKTIYG